MFETLSQYGLSDIHLMSYGACRLQDIIALHYTSLAPPLGRRRHLIAPSATPPIEHAPRPAQGMSDQTPLTDLSLCGGQAAI